MVGEQMIPLPLFDEPREKNLLVTEEKIVTPFIEILHNTIPKPNQTSLSSGEVPQTVSEALDELFPEQQYEEKSIQTAKEILGSIVKELSPEELKFAVVEMQFLVETWIDDFEKSIFDGLTLRELLHEKGKR
jgi:hypothetical protein